MRVLLVGSLLLSAGCTVYHNLIGVVAGGASGPNVPPAVIRTPDEFENFLRHARASGGSNRPDGLVPQLETARPDFDRQVLVLARCYSSGGSSFQVLRTSDDGRGTLTFHLRTRRQGMTRDHVPHWFAVVAHRPGPRRVEVRVDGELQPPEELAPTPAELPSLAPRDLSP